MDRAAKAFFEKDQELQEAYAALPGAWRVSRAEELEMCKLWAEYYIAKNHPLLAALSTLELFPMFNGDSELRFRCCVGEWPRAREYAGACIFARRSELTMNGSLHPAVRMQIEEPIRGAERYIANAIDKERADRCRRMSTSTP